MNLFDLIGDSRIEIPFTEPDYSLDGYCEDDTRTIAPYIDLLPEEYHKGGPKDTCIRNSISAKHFDAIREFDKGFINVLKNGI